MAEKSKKELDKEQAELKAIEKENKLIAFLLPIVSIFALALGVTGIILTMNAEEKGIFIFSIVLAGLGLIFLIVGIILIIKVKKPDLFKKKDKDEEDKVID